MNFNLEGYIKDSFVRFKRVRHSTSIKGFNNLVCVAVIDSLPNLFLNLFGKGRLKRLAELMLSNITLRVNGCSIRVNDFLAYHIMTDDSEAFMEQYFKPSAGFIVVDVGAHIGKYSVLWGKQVGCYGKVIALEPKKENYDLLLRNIRTNKLCNVHAYNCAAWKRNEVLTLFMGETSAAVSVHAYNYKRSFQVQAVTVDELVQNLKRVDMVKVDVEGAEADVLEGMSFVLSRFRPCLMLEVWAVNYDRVVGLLGRFNYSFFEVTPHLDCYGTWYTQVLAVPSKEAVK